MASAQEKKGSRTGGEAGSRKAAGKSSRNASARTADREPISEKKRHSRAEQSRSQSEPMDHAIRLEIKLLAFFAVCIFLFLCNLGFGGLVGDVVSGWMFGIFGLSAYVAPILFFVGVAFKISNRGNRFAARKLFAIIVLFLLLGMIFDMLTGAWAESEVYRLGEVYRRCSEGKNGGGILAGTLTWLGWHFLSPVGTVLLILVLGIICFVILTEKSFVSSVRTGSQKVYKKTREDVSHRREKVQQRREEQRRARQEWEEQQRILQEERENEKILRMDKKEMGVMLNTVLTVKQEAEKERTLPEEAETAREEHVPEERYCIGDEMHEIVFEDEEVYQKETVLLERAEKYEAGIREEIKKEEIKREEIKKEELYEMSEPARLEEVPRSDKNAYVPEERYGHAAAQENLRDVHMELEHTEMNPMAIAHMDMDSMAIAHMDMDPMAIAHMDTEPMGMDHSEQEEYGFPERQDLYSIPYEEEYTVYQEEPAVWEKEAGSYGETGKEARRRETRNSQPSVRETAVQQKEQAGMHLMPKGERQQEGYRFPPMELLQKGDSTRGGSSEQVLQETAADLQKTLATFGVQVAITNISQGPAVTRYELQPELGVKVSKIVGLTDDIKLNLAVPDIRIEAPIPGKRAVGIEVPNKEVSMVRLRDLLESNVFRDFSSRLAFAVGKDIGGDTIVADIGKMPHMLIAGATGSGKSVCINTLIMSILYKADPAEVKLIMIDPKVVELSVYNGIPHLLIPVVTDPKKASAALRWGVAEMDERYKLFADLGVRDLKGYNAELAKRRSRGETDVPDAMPQIVIIVDELADLMMVAPGEVEESICRLAQLARAAGLHLIIATQRPSVDVITGLIKANMPSRVAFAVSSGVDSRTILDMNGAEKLLGNGDMLFYPKGYPKPVRVQGAFVSDDEVGAVVDFLKNQSIGNVYSKSVEEKISSMDVSGNTGGAADAGSLDAYFAEAGRILIEKDKASIGMLQRLFKIGFNRAARIMDQLCEMGVVSEEEGTKPRKVLMGMEEFEQLIDEIM